MKWHVCEDGSCTTNVQFGYEKRRYISRGRNENAIMARKVVILEDVTQRGHVDNHVAKTSQ